jgi:hypothetical protein
MSEAARTVGKVLLSLLFGLFSVPMLGYGGYLFICWVRVHTSDVYYADYPYATAALLWFAFGMLNLLLTLHIVWRRTRHGYLLAIPFLVGLATSEIVINHTPRISSMEADNDCLSGIHSSLRIWYEHNHNFPSNEAEFREAAWQHSGGDGPESPYKQRGNLLPHQVVVVNNTEAARSTDVSQRPGVIYYCVSKDLQEFWVTMTRLQSDLASTAYIEQGAGLPEEFWVIHEAGRDYPIKRP